MDFWVPGSTSRMESPVYAGKPLSQQILEVTDATTILWVKRVTQDTYY